VGFVERVEVPITDPEAFEKVAPRALPILRAAPGCHGVRALRCVEDPDTYLLLIEWDSVEDHVKFTKTPEFAEFVGVVREFFAGPSKMHHFEQLLVLP
jgi:heme-degrading monooxygenase HmoA